MKQPYLRRHQRECIYFGTAYGDLLLLDLELRKLQREIDRELIKIKTWIQNKLFPAKLLQ